MVIIYLLIKLIRIAKFTIKFTYYTTSSNSYQDYTMKASRSY